MLVQLRHEGVHIPARQPAGACSRTTDPPTQHRRACVNPASEIQRLMKGPDPAPVFLSRDASGDSRATAGREADVNAAAGLESIPRLGTLQFRQA